jgi:hypothetical protein
MQSNSDCRAILTKSLTLIVLRMVFLRLRCDSFLLTPYYVGHFKRCESSCKNGCNERSALRFAGGGRAVSFCVGSVRGSHPGAGAGRPLGSILQTADVRRQADGRGCGAFRSCKNLFNESVFNNERSHSFLPVLEFVFVWTRKRAKQGLLGTEECRIDSLPLSRTSIRDFL